MVSVHSVGLKLIEYFATANATPTQPIQRTSNSLKGADVLNEVSLEAQNVPAWIDQSTLAPVNKSKVSDWTDMGLGYTMYLPETEGAVWTNDLSASVEAQKPHSQGYGQFSGSSTVEMSDAELPGSLQLSFQPPPPMTYSFQETTFARRVHRSCIERVYHLLLDPSRRQTEFERIFKLSLLGRDRKKLTASLKVVLDRGPHEDLDFWQAPLIHVGGAGTHYPRRDPFGNLVPKKSAYHLGIVGPQTLALLDNASRDSLSADMTIEIAGFEGEWFDPYDVQGYLEEKGIFIDPSSSFAEAELVEWSPSNSSISSASNAGNSEPSSLPKSTPLTQGQLTRLSEANADLSQWNDFTDMELGAVGFSDSKMGSWMNFLQPGEGIKMPNDADTLNQMVDWDDYNLNALPNDVSNTILPVSNPATPPPRKKNIIIDVSKLVDGKRHMPHMPGRLTDFAVVLTISGVCLGRSPGFRRRDVDRALALSSFDAF